LAHIKSQVKRNRQNEKKRMKNAQIRSSIRTTAKRVVKAAEGNDKEAAQAEFRKFVKAIDSTAHKGIVPRRTAARKKSRLAKKVNAVLAQ